jgi:hypothetical protein
MGTIICFEILDFRMQSWIGLQIQMCGLQIPMYVCEDGLHHAGSAIFIISIDDCSKRFCVSKLSDKK